MWQSWGALHSVEERGDDDGVEMEVKRGELMKMGKLRFENKVEALAHYFFKWSGRPV